MSEITDALELVIQIESLVRQACEEKERANGLAAHNHRLTAEIDKVCGLPEDGKTLIQKTHGAGLEGRVKLLLELWEGDNV